MTRTIEQAIDGLIVKSLKTWKIIRPGERVLVGASGGKDSAILARALASMRAQGRLDAEVSALHLRNDFAPDSMSAALAEAYASWGMALESLEVAVIGRLKPGRKMNCYWCATQRRTELIRHAMAHGYTAVALGHHLDDVLETLLMNMLDKAELSTMPPVLDYSKYPLRIIRPLYLVEERQIIELAGSLGLLATTCSCGYGDRSRRDVARARLEALTGGSGDAKRNLIESLRKIDPEYLPR